MVNAVLTQRIFCLFSTFWYFKSHRIFSHCLNPFCFPTATDQIQDKVGIVHTNIPAEGENSPTKEPPMGENTSTTRQPTQTEERANLEHPDKEIKETAALIPTELLQ